MNGVEEEIGRLQQQYAELVTVEKEKPEKGDFVVIDFDGYIDGKPFPGGAARGFLLEIGAGRFFPEFEKGNPGMQVGEEKEIKVSFPKDARQDLAGKKASSRLNSRRLRSGNSRRLTMSSPKASGWGETVAELREAIRKGLQNQAELEAERAFQRAVVEKVVDGSEVAISETLLQREMDHLLHEFEHDLTATRGIKLEQYLEGAKKSKEEFMGRMLPNSGEKNQNRVGALFYCRQGRNYSY